MTNDELLESMSGNIDQILESAITLRCAYKAIRYEVATETQMMVRRVAADACEADLSDVTIVYSHRNDFYVVERDKLGEPASFVLLSLNLTKTRAIVRRFLCCDTYRVDIPKGEGNGQDESG